MKHSDHRLLTYLFMGQAHGKIHHYMDAPYAYQFPVVKEEKVLGLKMPVVRMQKLTRRHRIFRHDLSVIRDIAESKRKRKDQRQAIIAAYLHLIQDGEI